MKCQLKTCAGVELRDCQESECPVKAYIKEIVDNAPPLAPEQRDTLSIILGPSVKAWRMTKGKPC